MTTGTINMNIIRLPKTLRDKLGEQASDDLVVVFDQLQTSQTAKTIEKVEGKFETQLIKTKLELKEEIGSVRELVKASENSLVWKMIALMGTQTALILGCMYFLHSKV